MTSEAMMTVLAANSALPYWDLGDSPPRSLNQPAEPILFAS